MPCSYLARLDISALRSGGMLVWHARRETGTMCVCVCMCVCCVVVVCVVQVEVKARRLLHHYEQSLAAVKRGNDSMKKSVKAKLDGDDTGSRLRSHGSAASSHISDMTDKQMFFLEARHLLSGGYWHCSHSRLQCAWVPLF